MTFRITHIVVGLFFLVTFLVSKRSGAQCSLDLGNDTVMCAGPVTFDAGPGYHSYEWSTGSTDQAITVNSIGAYGLTVTEVGANIVYNGDFELGNIGFTSDYLYNAASLWNEGTFWVGNNAATVHPNFTGWDHTPAPGVNFLVCNGSSTFGDVIWEQVVNVTPGIDYIFSTWICSVHPSFPAQLRFFINNVPVGLQINAPGVTGQWIQFYELWNSGANTTVTISIINQTVASSGNDFGLDDIYFAPVVPCVDTVMVNPSDLAATINPTHIACKGESTGVADLVVTGGYPLYAYNWSNAAPSEDLNNVAAGTYQVTVTDAATCTTEATITLTEPAVDLQFSQEATAINCFGDANGAIDLTVFGGTLPYTYSWSNGSAQEDLNNIDGGLYTVTITDQEGCERIVPIDVFEPDELEVLLIGNNLSCHGDTDGSIQIIVAGGIADYLYNWSSGPTTAGIHNLPSGTYTVTVTDNNACIAIENVSLSEPSSVNLYASADQTICLGQSTDIVTGAFGGTPPYDYYWNPGGYGTSTINVKPEVSTQYCTYIEDANNCSSGTVCVTITVNPALDLEIELSEDSICRGDTILLHSSAEGGNGGPYLYELATGQSIEDNEYLVPEHSSKIIVIAYDGCGTPAARDTLNIYVKEQPNVSFMTNVIQGCPPLEVQFTNIYSEPEYSYSWDFDDSDYFNNSIEENPRYIFRNSGEYDITLEITNELGCKAKQTMNNLIDVWEKPIAAFTVDQQSATIANPVFNFQNLSTGAANYFWHFGTDSLMVEHPSEQRFPSPGEYLISLAAENIDGCRDTSYMLVHVEELQTVYVPNAIHPFSNYLGNRIFKPFGDHLMSEHYYLAIYSRWGELIFESTEYDNGWNGKSKGGTLVAPGSYVWILKYADLKGNLIQDTGNIHVIY